MPPLTLGFNLPAARAIRRVNEASRLMANATTALSSGLRINKASDDAAGLALASNLKLSGRVYSQAIRNANDGISKVNIAEGALTDLNAIVIRLKELAYQSMNGTVSNTQRVSLNTEAQALASEYDRIGQAATFNGQTIFQLDGATDIQVGFGAAETITVNFGDGLEEKRGTGSYSQGITYSISSGTDGIDTGDFNNDGLVDVIRSRYGRLQLTLGNGDGTFKAPISHMTVNSAFATIKMDLGDFNGDTRLDVATLSTFGNSVQISLGNGNGTFLRSTTVVIPATYTGTGAPELEVRDINGDGKPDLVVLPDTYAGPNEVRFYMGNGDGTFATPVSYLSGNQPLIAAFADTNGDGIDDLISLGRLDSRIYLGNGDGTFRFVSTLGSVVNINGRVADLNNDGLADIITDGGVTGSSRVFLSNGNGTFRVIATQSMVTSDMQIVRDLNNDGNIDIVGSRSTSDNYLNVYLGNGDGTFAAGTTITTPGGTFISTTAADINGDGLLELFQGGNYSVFNSFNPSFTYLFTLKEFNLLTKDSAKSAVNMLDSAQTRIIAETGNLGASSSRLDTALTNLSSYRNGIEEARSRIEDADVAMSAAQLVKAKILQQAANAILAQGLLQPKIALKLLKD